MSLLDVLMELYGIHGAAVLLCGFLLAHCTFTYELWNTAISGFSIHCMGIHKMKVLALDQNNTQTDIQHSQIIVSIICMHHNYTDRDNTHLG